MIRKSRKNKNSRKIKNQRYCRYIIYKREDMLNYFNSFGEKNEFKKIDCSKCNCGEIVIKYNCGHIQSSNCIKKFLSDKDIKCLICMESDILRFYINF